jgi:hypothetical protein
LTSVSTPRVVVTGIVATMALTAALALGPLIGAPPLNLPLWDGTFFTLNLTLAVALGYLAHFAIGVALALVYLQGVAPRLGGEPWLRGAVFGLLVWVALLLVGLPLFDALDPLVENGLMAAPGFLAMNLGLSGALMLLVGHLVYGAILGGLIGDPGFQAVRRRAY